MGNYTDSLNVTRISCYTPVIAERSEPYRRNRVAADNRPYWMPRLLRGFGRRKRATMTNTYFATALVSAHSVGVTIHAENIGTAFKIAEDYLQERNPQSEVIVQAVQRISNEFADGCNVSSRSSNR